MCGIPHARGAGGRAVARVLLRVVHLVRVRDRDRVGVRLRVKLRLRLRLRARVRVRVVHQVDVLPLLHALLVRLRKLLCPACPG